MGNGKGKNAKIEPLPGQLNQQANSVVRRTTFREAASVIANAESGIIGVRATAACKLSGLPLSAFCQPPGAH